MEAVIGLPPSLLYANEHVITVLVRRLQTPDPSGDLATLVEQVGQLPDRGQVPVVEKVINLHGRKPIGAKKLLQLLLHVVGEEDVAPARADPARSVNAASKICRKCCCAP